MNRFGARALAFIFMPILVASAVHADAPRTLQFQGVLTDDDGLPLDGSYAVTFSLYSDTTGGADWSQTTNVAVDGGYYEASLEVDTLSFDTHYYLGLSIGDAQLGPKKRLGSVPYALSLPDGAVTEAKIAAGQVVKSINSLTDSVTLAAGNNVNIATSGDSIVISASNEGAGADDDWTVSGDNVYRDSGNVGIGTTDPISTLDVDGTLRAWGYIGLSDWPDGRDPVIYFGSNFSETLGLDSDSSRFELSDPLSVVGPLHVGPSASLNENRNYNYFSEGSSPTPESDLMAGADDLYVMGNLEIGDSLYVRSNVEAGWNVSAGHGIFSEHDITVGSSVGSDNDYVYFDSNHVEYLAWQDDSARFNLSDDLNLMGTLAAGPGSWANAQRPYHYFSASINPAPTSGLMANKGDLFVGTDLEVGNNLSVGGQLWMTGTDGTDRDIIYFDEPYEEYLAWENDSSMFKFSDDLSIVGKLWVSNFGGHRLENYNYFTTNGTPSPLSGVISSGSDLYVADDIEAGDRVYAWGFVDLTPGPAAKSGGELLSFAEATNVLDALVPVSYLGEKDRSEGKSGNPVARVGFQGGSLPAEVSGPDGKGCSILDLTVVLTRIIQEQQETINKLKSEKADRADIDTLLLTVTELTQRIQTLEEGP